MQLIQTVAPIAEPLTLEETKAFLRILDVNDDLLIASMISTAREHVENVTNRQIEVATFELYADCFISKLPKNPVQSIVKIEYMDENGSYVELLSSSYYLYEKSGISFIEYTSKPTVKTHKKAVKITFTSGYLQVPEAIKQYLKVKISTMFENREEFVIGANISSFGGNLIENLLSSYRIRSI